MKLFFENIAKREKGKLIYKKTKPKTAYALQISMVSFEEYYKLIIPYNSQKIIIIHQINPSLTGSFKVNINLQKSNINFDIESNNHFIQLFRPNSDSVKVKCNNKDFKSFIKGNEHFKTLVKLINETEFTPLIYTTYKSKELTIISEYHTSFENNTTMIEPLIKFYKSLIDEILIMDKINSSIIND